MKASSDWQDSLRSLLGGMEPDPTADEAPAEADVPAKATDKTKSDVLAIAFERKGRAGKCATIVYGFTCGDDEVEALAAAMKKKLGTGGSARGGEILIQGDRRDDVRRFLAEKGYKTKG